MDRMQGFPVRTPLQLVEGPLARSGTGNDDLGAQLVGRSTRLRGYLRAKRALDLALGGLALLVAAPLLLALAVLVRATSPGPALFWQRRCGQEGRIFWMPKLRTMVADAERQRGALRDRNEMDGPAFKIQDDPRVTPVGRLLRRFSLDELPQLWNVVRGEMSLVGPRPAVPGEVARYARAQRRRIAVRPGLTCLWQISGRNRLGFEDWVRLDLAYIDRRSLRLDLEILLRTLPAVLRGTGW